MTKLRFGIFAVGALVSMMSIAFAVTPDDVLVGEDRDLDPKATTNAIGLMFNFCVDGQSNRRIETLATPGDDVPLCIKISNTSSVTQDYEVRMRGGSIKPNGNVKCGGYVEGLPEYVTGIAGIYTVPAGEELEVQGVMNFPASVAGNVYGCVAMNKWLDPEKYAGGAGIVAEAKTIKVFVDSNISVGLNLAKPDSTQGVKSISNNKNVFVGHMGESFKAILGFDNIGSLNQDVTANIKVTDILGNELASLSGVNTVISAKQKGELAMDLPEIPWYKMSFKITYDITHQATSTIVTEFITDEMLSPHDMTVTATFFLFPWWILAVLLVLIILWKIAGHMAKKTRQRRQELEELRHYVHDHESGQQQ